MVFRAARYALLIGARLGGLAFQDSRALSMILHFNHGGLLIRFDCDRNAVQPLTPLAGSEHFGRRVCWWSAWHNSLTISKGFRYERAATDSALTSDND